MTTQITNTLIRAGFATLGGILGAFEKSVPLLFVLTLAVFLDALTAWRLARRLSKKYQDPRASGKFRSRAFGKVFQTLWLLYSLILLAFMIQDIAGFGDYFPLANIIMAGASFWQLWSILENESSCSDAKWAKFLQRFMVDKATRHLDIDLRDITEDKQEEQADKGKQEQKQEDKQDNPPKGSGGGGRPTTGIPRPNKHAQTEPRHADDERFHDRRDDQLIHGEDSEHYQPPLI